MATTSSTPSKWLSLKLPARWNPYFPWLLNDSSATRSSSPLTPRSPPKARLTFLAFLPDRSIQQGLPRSGTSMMDAGSPSTPQSEWHWQPVPVPTSNTTLARASMPTHVPLQTTLRSCSVLKLLSAPALCVRWTNAIAR
jgi:hypothetical protein